MDAESVAMKAHGEETHYDEVPQLTLDVSLVWENTPETNGGRVPTL